jgi:hypothetical protein
VIPAYDGKATDAKAQGAAFDKTLASTLKGAGYPAKADPAQLNWPMTIVILTILVIYVTMVYGPIAAMLVEMFPTRIRYTSMSLPYHIGNGWFGGFLPRPRSRSWRRRATSIRPLVSDRDRAGDVRDRRAVRRRPRTRTSTRRIDDGRAGGVSPARSAPA